MVIRWTVREDGTIDFSGEGTERTAIFRVRDWVHGGCHEAILSNGVRFAGELHINWFRRRIVEFIRDGVC